MGMGSFAILNCLVGNEEKAEARAYIEKHTGPYSLLLDNRNQYTKSDCLVWSASLCDNKEDFTKIVDRLWLA